MHIKKISLLVLSCVAFSKPYYHNLYAAVPMKRQPSLTDYYDPQKLKVIEDSLKKIDPRNSITPELGRFIEGKLFFGVSIYSPSEPQDREYVTIQKIGMTKNRCIIGSLALSNVIAPCAYEPEEAYVGVNYMDDQSEELYFGNILNGNQPGRPCKVAIATEF